MLKSMLQAIGFNKSVFMNKNKKYRKYNIGDWTYGNPLILLGRTHGELSIGKYCSIAPSVEFTMVGDHRSDFVSTFPFSVFFKEFRDIKGFPKNRGDINIGNDVWICTGANILAGTTVGDGAVIGYKAVVVKDVPPYAVVGGNPAKIIRYRFSEEKIEKLLSIRWWNWPHEDVLKAVQFLMSNRIDQFIEWAEKRTE